MIKNYITIAFRHLTKHTFFSLINIICLAIGITLTMFIGAYITHEKEVNQNLADIENQYVLNSNWKVKEMGLEVTTLGSLARTLHDEYPNLVENYFRYNPVTNVVNAGDQHFKEDIAIADTTLVSMYNFPLLYGDKNRAFTNVNSAVITEAFAKKLYGTANAVGKRLSLQTTVNGIEQQYLVSAVLKDVPYNSVTDYISDHYNLYVPTIGSQYFSGTSDPAEDWKSANEIGFIKLKKGITTASLTQPIKTILAKYTTENVQKNLTVTLLPLQDYYLKANNGAVDRMINILSTIALFILLMAIINFVNISIGTSSYRLKEIGLRKVFGSARWQLIFQFITESVILTFIATLLSVGLYQLLRPLFNGILNTEIASIWQITSWQMAMLLLFIIGIGLIAGIYPAFIVSSSNIVTLSKGKTNNISGSLWLRKGLLVLQFSLAMIVFINALIIAKQISYVYNKDLGYNREHLLVVAALPKQWDSIGIAKMEAIKSGLQQLPVVKNISLSFEVPDRQPPSTIDILPDNAKTSKPLLITVTSADNDFAATYQLQLLSGEFFAQKGGYIPNQIVLNESAAKALGYTINNSVNRKIKVPSFNNAEFTIAGVIKDYNYSSLQQQIQPLAFLNAKDVTAYRYFTIKLNTTNITEALDDIKTKWKQLTPNSPFQYSFMDDNFAHLYATEMQLKKATNLATVLNLIIIFLGVFGVVAFTLAKRSKEIAVRKVLGANERNIIWLFVKDYSWLILVSVLISCPLAYLVSYQWLQQYAYRVQQTIEPYIAVSVIIFVLVSILIVIQSLKTAFTNPVHSLRNE